MTNGRNGQPPKGESDAFALLQPESPVPSSGRSLFVGIDEAGYGPNLGPLVVGAAAFLGPVGYHTEDWWKKLRPCAGRAGSKSPFWVDDSKRIFSGTNGSPRLATQVAAWMSTMLPRARLFSTLAHWIDAVAPLDGHACRGEHWYSESYSCALTDPVPSVDQLLKQLDKQSIRPAFLRARLVFAPEFNRDLAQCDSKAVVETTRITSLVGEALSQWKSGHFEAEEAHVWIDRLGGRKNYREMVEDWAGDSFVLTVEESTDRSVYRFDCGGRPVEVVFRVQGDQKYFPIALASMLAKYLRELSMAQFNHWWCSQVEGLRPTAGYPQDARRFYKEIEPHIGRLGINKEALWRQK